MVVAGSLLLANAGPAAALESVRVAIVSRTVFYAPLWIAQRQGFLRDEGLDVSVEVFDSAERIDEALRSGAVRIAISTPEGPIVDAYRGGSLRIVAGNAGRLPHFVIAKPGTTSLAGLRGANIGVLSLREGTTYLVHAVARAAGLTPADYTVTAVGGAPTRWRMMREGRIDAGLQPFPLSYEAEAAGFANLGPVSAVVPDWQFTSVNLDDVWGREHPELVAAFLRGLARGQDHMSRNPEEAATVAAEELRTNLALARRALEDTRRLGILSEDLAVNEAGLTRVFEALREAGHVPADTAYDTRRIVAPEYLRMSRDVRVRDTGSFFVGGTVTRVEGQAVREVRYARDAPPLRVDPNGDHPNGQLYAQYVRLGGPARPVPILFLNGGTSTGASWETTPDGRPGWQSFFLRQGYGTVLTDAIGKGRASWARYPEVFPVEPIFRPNEETWPLLRIGPRYRPDPAAREVYEDVRFPVAHWEDFAKQGVPRFAGFDGRDLEAVDAVLRRIGPAVIIGQSSGAYIGAQLAARHPDLVRALVAVEMTAAPDLSSLDAAALGRVPQLLLWGDNLGAGPWPRIRSAVDGYAAAMRERGAALEVIDLPSRGVRGNTHQMMMDNNSDAIALLVARWLDERVR